MLEVPQHKEIASCQNILVRNLQYCTKNQQFSTWNKGYKFRKKGLVWYKKEKKLSTYTTKKEIQFSII